MLIRVTSSGWGFKGLGFFREGCIEEIKDVLTS